MSLFAAMEFRQNSKAGGAQKETEARDERAQNGPLKVQRGPRDGDEQNADHDAHECFFGRLESGEHSQEFSINGTGYQSSKWPL